MADTLSSVPAITMVVHGHQDLKGHRGAIHWYSILDPVTHAFRDAMEACCPGCSEHVATFMPDAYQISGELRSPTIEGEIHWSYCCGWKGMLVDGRWIPLG